MKGLGHVQALFCQEAKYFITYLAFCQYLFGFG